MNLLLFLRVPLRPTVADDDRTPVKSLLGMPAFLIALVLMMTGRAAELTMVQWSSFFAEQGVGVPKGTLASSGFFEPVARILPDDGGSGLRAALLTSAVVHLVFALCVPLVAPRSWPVHSGSELE